MAVDSAMQAARIAKHKEPRKKFFILYFPKLGYVVAPESFDRAAGLYMAGRKEFVFSHIITFE